jgi:predicted alpha/beta-fold hydrolase
VTPHGGHCAFLERPAPGYDGYWAEREIVRFVKENVKLTIPSLA